MSEKAVYTLSVNRKTGELQVQSEQPPESTGVGKELRRVIDQQQQSKYLTVILILAFLGTFFMISLFKDDIKFSIGLIVLTIAALIGYIVVYYIDHLTIICIMDTIKKIVRKPTQNGQNTELTDEKSEPVPEINSQDKKKKKSI